MVHHEIVGDDLQAVILTLGSGNVVRAEAGEMMFMTDTIDMDATMEGGFLGGLKRKFNAAQRGDREEVKRDLGGMLGGAGRSLRRRQVSPLAGNMGFFAGSRPACCRHGAAPGAAGE